MKRGALADTAVNQICQLGPVSGKHIRLCGGEQRHWRVGELTQDCVAADDYDFRIVCDRPGRANYMLKLGTLHRSACALLPSGPLRTGKIVELKTCKVFTVDRD